MDPAGRGWIGRPPRSEEGGGHPFWDTVRQRVAEKAMDMRRQGFSGAAMLPWSELEYTGVVERLKALDRRFVMRGGSATAA